MVMYLLFPASFVFSLSTKLYFGTGLCSLGLNSSSKKKKRSVMLELINGFKRNCVCSCGIEFRLTVWRIYVFINHAVPHHFFMDLLTA